MVLRRLLALLAMMGGARIVTCGLVPAGAMPPVHWQNLTDPKAPHQPLEAHGQPLLIQARIGMRCRYAFTDIKRRHKVYRIFKSRSSVDYPQWCEDMEAALRRQCGRDELGPDEVEWLRCDTETRDIRWQAGAVAAIKLNVPGDARPRCVARAVKESVPGSEVDWMGQKGCYEAHGFEIEY